MAHLQEQLAAEPTLRSALAAAVERRHDVLASTGGLEALQGGFEHGGQGWALSLGEREVHGQALQALLDRSST